MPLGHTPVASRLTGGIVSGRGVTVMLGLTDGTGRPRHRKRYVPAQAGACGGQIRVAMKNQRVPSSEPVSLKGTNGPRPSGRSDA